MSERLSLTELEARHICVQCRTATTFLSARCDECNKKQNRNNRMKQHRKIIRQRGLMIQPKSCRKEAQ